MLISHIYYAQEVSIPATIKTEYFGIVYIFTSSAFIIDVIVLVATLVFNYWCQLVMESKIPDMKTMAKIIQKVWKGLKITGNIIS